MVLECVTSWLVTPVLSPLHPLSSVHLTTLCCCCAGGHLGGRHPEHRGVQAGAQYPVLPRAAGGAHRVPALLRPLYLRPAGEQPLLVVGVTSRIVLVVTIKHTLYSRIPLTLIQRIAHFMSCENEFTK